MAWRKPDRDDIVATLSKDEVDAYSQSAEWSSDPIERLCDRAAALVRDHLRTNGQVVLSPEEGEIPESCISPAMDYLAVDILKRIGLPVSDARKEARRDALQFFYRIDDGIFTPESYGETAALAPKKAASPAVGTPNPSKRLCD